MFHSIREMIDLANTSREPLHEIVLQAESEQSQMSRGALRSKMRERLEVMRRSAERGMQQPVQSISGMSGGSAFRFSNWMGKHHPVSGPLLGKAVARALAVTEVNAGMGCIVAAPTAGASGILPAVLLSLQEERGYNDEQLIDALFTAGGIGSVIAYRSQVSGAARGCQAETGSAAAMAAGAAVELLGGTPAQTSQAVAIALKNMLGLVCDPVAGMVEIPCVKRNASATAICFVAVDLAMAGIESAIPADEVIEAMDRIGQRMDERFKETAQGGLAATPTGKKLAEKVVKERTRLQ